MQRFIKPLLLVVAYFCTLFAHAEGITRLSGKTMGTYWQVTLADTLPAERVKTVQAAIEATLHEVNREMSTFIPDSEISQFNRRQDQTPQKISPGFMTNVRTAQKISAQSGGVYDITVEPLVDLWGFGPDKITQEPSREAIAAARAKVGYQNLIVDEKAGTIAKGRVDMKIGLSSIAKGYGVDQVAQTLSDFKFHNFIVDIGGEVLVRGNRNGQAWHIAVEKPEAGSAAQVVLPIELKPSQQLAMATSGNYRNFINYKDLRAVHTIDPRTGYSSISSLLSVTVVAPDCMHADGYATALMALGSKGAEAFAEQEHLAVLMIYAGKNGEFRVTTTPAWKEYFPNWGQENGEVKSPWLATFLVVFAIMLIVVLIMAIGVFFGRKPIKGSCGGLGNVGVEKACGCTDGCKEEKD